MTGEETWLGDVALALTLTGCGVVTDVGGSRDPSPTPTTSMPDILRKAAASLDRGPYSFQFADPAHAKELFAGIAAAEPAGERRYRGTLDLTRVPFEASVDSQGRLLGFQFTLPSAGGEPESSAEISYSGHGFNPDLSGPFKGRIGPAPASIYKIING